MAIEPKFVLLVKVPRGLWILDTPRPESQGASRRRVVPVGTVLRAYEILNVEGVPYAWLVPQNPVKAEWVRVREADSSVEYVQVIPVEETAKDEIARALNRIADALEKR